MATEIEINTKINTASSAQSLNELRKGLKDLISLQGQVGQGDRGFKQLQQAINDTEGRIGDLTDSFNTLKGSGVERLNSSLNLLREGFTSADPGKLKTAFSGLSAAMSAIPIFLLIEGLNFLANNFEEVVKVVKSAIGVVDEQAEAQKRLQKELQNTALQVQDLGISYKFFEQNRQLALDLEIEKLKQRGATQEQIDAAIIKSEEKKLEKLKKAREEANQLGVLELSKYNDAVFEQQDKLDLLYAKTETARVENNRKANEKLKAQREQKLKDDEAAAQAELDQAFKLAQNQQFVEQQRQLDDANAEKELNLQRAAINKQIDDDIKNNKLKNDQEEVASNIAKWRAEEEAARKAAEERNRLEANVFKIAEQSNQGLMALSQLYFDSQIKNARGNSEEEIKLKKKAFKVEKAFAISKASIDGTLAVMNALKVSPYPVGVALAISAGVVAAANIAKIATAQFNPGTTSSSAAPTFSNPQSTGSSGFNQPQTPSRELINPTGIANAQTSQRTERNRVYVVESDIRNVTNRVNVIESRATF